MNRKRIIFSCGGVLLIIFGAFADRAIIKFSVSGLYFTGPGVTTCTPIESGIPFPGTFITSSSSLNQATINTCGANTYYRIYATSNCVDKAYFIG